MSLKCTFPLNKDTMLTAFRTIGGKIKDIHPATSKAAVTLSKYSPQILTGIGIVAVVGGTALACVATLKAKDVCLDFDARQKELANDQARIKAKQESGEIPAEEYTEKDIRRDNALLTLQRAGALARLYMPAIVTTGLGIACILKGSAILTKRNAALATAYVALQKQFDSYRGRVREKYGEEVELDIFHNRTVIKEKVTELDDDGKKHTKTVTKRVYDPSCVSIYAKYFDESSRFWSPDWGTNQFFLGCQLEKANELLRRRGHVFLNEVYDLLDIPRTPEGNIVGWIYGKPGGDSYIDFGLYDGRDSSRRFVNANERSVLLDFNVDGPIYELI